MKVYSTVWPSQIHLLNAVVPVKTSEDRGHRERPSFLGGKQLAIDTTMVSVLTGQGVVREAVGKAWPSRLRMPSAGDTTSWSTGQVPPPSDGVRGSHEAVSSVNTEDSQPFHSFVVLPTWDSATTLLGLPLGACSCVNGPSVRASGLRVTDCSFSSFRQKKKTPMGSRASPRTPCPRTTGTVMAKAVQRTATPAEARGKGSQTEFHLGASPHWAKEARGTTTMSVKRFSRTNETSC